ncbi:MAG: 3D domain-containing protein [Candidatus Nealsonbacteria bacterium]
MKKTLKTGLILITLAGIIGTLPILAPKAKAPTDTLSKLSTIEGNSLISNSPLPEPVVVKQMNVIITAYSSTLEETDNNPYITAAGTWVRDGIVANNYLPFGTKIRIPELYGDKIFVVEDRMNWKKGNYHFDIWFQDTSDAIDFGAKTTYIEVIQEI